MMIMKMKTNVTQKCQIEDLEDIFFPIKFQKILGVCKNIPFWKQKLYLRSPLCCVTKLIGVQWYGNDNGKTQKFDNHYCLGIAPIWKGSFHDTLNLVVGGELRYFLVCLLKTYNNISTPTFYEAGFITNWPLPSMCQIAKKEVHN